nr:type VI secretion system-associated FHA domain protein TagH [Rheinheimera maricola]
MLLELSVVSYHRLSPRQAAVKRFDATGGTLGRSEQADWFLPDPERVVSGVHALICYKNSEFSIEDKSTNGLFVNRSVDALGQGNRHILQHGDVLCMGDYEIQVALVDSVTKVNNDTHINADVTTTSAVRQTASLGIPIADVAVSAFSTNAANPVDSAVGSHIQNRQREMTLDDHFSAPTALIPDDWGSDWLNTESEGLPEIPQAKPVATRVNKIEPQQNINDAPACLLAFLNGLGVSEANQQLMNSVQWWEQLGQAFQQSLHGVIEVMRERSNVKSTFRVNQTTFQQRENNPLKFSANIDEAFHNLFNRPGSSFMPAKQAIAEAFADISRHESAIVAGAAGAMDGLLQQLAPQHIEATDYGGSFVDKVNPAQRQARYWQRYKALHVDLAAELNSKDKQGVNDDFIRAYEAFLRQK